MFSINLAASAVKYCGKEAVNQSAASAASPDSVKFQAVIKSAASAASRKTKNQGPRSRGAHRRRLGMRTTGLGWAPLDLGPCFLVFLEAALAADLITA